MMDPTIVLIILLTIRIMHPCYVTAAIVKQKNTMFENDNEGILVDLLIKESSNYVQSTIIISKEIII